MSTSAADRLARIRALEEQRCLVAAAQAAEVALLVAEQADAVETEIAAVRTPGIGSNRRRQHAHRQLVAEIAKARRISPYEAGQYVTWACEAPTATPETFGLLAAGQLSERRAMTVARVTAPLTPEQRRAVDTELAPRLPGWGDREVDTAARAAVYRVDPAGVVARNAHAQSERRVTTRPAPEAMGWLTTLATLPQIVSARVALERAVLDAKARGDERTSGQIMADTLIERVTGQAQAPEVPVAVQLLITDRTLLGHGSEPARFDDGTPFPAPLARDLVLDSAAARRVTRLFADPAGRVVTAETHSRAFTPAMAAVIRWRDGGICTTDWCNAPIRHTDHVDPHSNGGPTSIANGRGTCVWCNETKSDRVPDTPPAVTRPPGRRRRRSRVERLARRRIAMAKQQRQPILVDVRYRP